MTFCVHKWKYLDKEHRICKKCGESQNFCYISPYNVHTDEGDYIAQGIKKWEHCSPETLKLEVEKRKNEIIVRSIARESAEEERREQEKKQEIERSRERKKALLLLSQHDRNGTLRSSNRPKLSDWSTGNKRWLKWITFIVSIWLLYGSIVYFVFVYVAKGPIDPSGELATLIITFGMISLLIISGYLVNYNLSADAREVVEERYPEE